MPRAHYGQAIVAASFLIQGVTVGGLFAFGVLFTELEAEFGWSRATIAAASSLNMLTMGALAVLAGRLSDRLGPRLVLTVSAVAYGAGYMLMSALGATWQLYLFWGILVGIGMSTHDVVTLSTVARWFPERRGIVSGVVKLGTASGQLAIPLVAAALIAAFGWRAACQAFGLAALVALLVAAQAMRRDPHSAASGALPPGAGVSASHGGPGLREALRLPALWILCGSQFIVFACLMTTTVHIVPHAVDLGLERAAAAGLLSAVGGASMLARVAIGGAIDRVGGRRALLAAYAVLLASFAWLQFAQAPWALYAFAALYGFAHGGFFTATSPTVAEMFGTRAHGVLFGTVLFFGSLGGALGPIAAGAAYDATSSYRAAFAVLALLAAAGFALVTRLGRGRAGW